MKTRRVVTPVFPRRAVLAAALAVAFMQPLSVQAAGPIMLTNELGWLQEGNSIYRQSGSVGIGGEPPANTSLFIRQERNGSIIMMHGAGGARFGIGTDSKLPNPNSMVFSTGDAIGNQVSRLVIGGGTDTSSVSILQGASGSESPITSFSPGGVQIFVPLDVNGLFNVKGNLTASGTITTSGNFMGDGSGLTGLNAGMLSAGIVPRGRLSGQYDIEITRNAATATRLATPISISVSGDATGSFSGFDGSSSLNIPLTLNPSVAPTFAGLTLNGLLSGADAVFSGALSVTSLNKVAITPPATSARLTLANNSTLATVGAFTTTLTATGNTALTLPTTGTLATLAGSEALTNKTVTLQNGNVAVPALNFGGSLGTGLYSPAVNQISIAASGNEILRVTSAGADLRTGVLAVGGQPVIDAGRNLTPAAITSTGNVVVGGNLQVLGASEFRGSVFGNAENSAFAWDLQYNRLGFVKKSGYAPQIAAVSNTPIVFAHSSEAKLGVDVGSSTLTERMRIDTFGNVGIGSASPEVKLDVAGTIRSNSTAYPNFAYNAVNRIAFGETYAPPNDTGSVVQFGSGSSARNMLFAFSKTGVNTSFFGNDGSQMMLGSEAAVPITFRTGLNYGAATVMGSGAERMRLTSDGRLGIGTATPAQALDVSGAIAVGGTTVIDGSRNLTNVTLNSNMPVTQGYGIRFGHANQTDGNDGYIGSGLFGTGLNIVGTQTSAGVGRQIRLWGTLLDAGGAVYVKNNDSPTFSGMTLNGDVTGGSFVVNDATSSNGSRPAKGVYVWTEKNFGMELQNQNGTWNTAFVTRGSDGGFAWKKSDGTQFMYMNNSGNIGIGTNSPGAKLQVVGAVNITNGATDSQAAMASGSLTIGGGSANFGGGTNWNTNTAGLLLETFDNTEIAVHDANTRLASLAYYEGGANNRITIGRDMGWGTISSVVLNGNVGIGTASPAYKLDVAGSLNASSLYINGVAVTSSDGNFGQLTGHAAFTDFNTDPGRWGWSYVQGTGNSPHAGTQGGYRMRVGLGSEYARTSYALETAIPRASSGGGNYMYTRQLENGTWVPWSKLDAGNADTAAQVVKSVTGTNSAELVRGNMADNDQFRILVGGTASNAGFAEIATADDGNEPIYVRQYGLGFGSVVRTAALLDGSGNTSFPGNVGIGTSAPAYKVDVSGDIRATGSLYGNSAKVGVWTGGGAYRGLYHANMSGAEYGLIMGDTDKNTYLSSWSGGSVVLRGGANSATYELKVSGSSRPTVANQVLIDAGNINDYAPTKTGGGASGTWGINITGSAPWSSITGKPTTLTGYGITDALNLAGGTITGDVIGGSFVVNDNTSSNGSRPRKGVYVWTDKTFGMELQNQNGTWNTAFVTRVGDGGFAWKKSDGTQFMYMNNSGNLGIGTTAPTEKLHVAGNGYFAGKIRSDSTAYPNFEYNSVNRVVFGELYPVPYDTSTVAQFGSGSADRNMLFAFGKTDTNTSFLGNDGRQMMLGSEAEAPITFRTQLQYYALDVMSSGTERMRLTSDGKLGIGTTAPTQKLHVVGNGYFSGDLSIAGQFYGAGALPTNPVYSFGSSTNTGMYLPAAGVLAFSTSGTQRMRIDSSGISTGGNITPGGVIVVQNNVNGGPSKGIRMWTASNTDWGIYMGQAGDGLSFSGGYATPGLGGEASHAIRFRVPKNSGNAFIWESNDETALMSLNGGTGALRVGGNGYFQSGLTVVGNLRVNGTINGATFPSGTSGGGGGTDYSDARLKTNIHSLSNPLDIISKVSGVSYYWDRARFPDMGFGPERQYGVIAQELEKVLPDLVRNNSNGFKSVSYTGLIPILNEGIKELDGKVQKQAMRITSVEDKIKLTDEWIAKSDRRFQSLESVISVDGKVPQAGLFVPTSGTLAFSAGGAQRMTIDAKGNVGVGVSTPAGKLDVNGDVVVRGTVYNSADGGLKTNLQKIEAPLEKVATITGYRFNWKESGQADMGVTAQEVQKAFPELVKFVPTPDRSAPPRLAVNYNGLVAPLVESVKVLRTENEKLVGKNADMERKLAEQAQATATRNAALERQLMLQGEVIQKLVLQQQQQAQALQAAAQAAATVKVVAPASR